MKWIGGIMSPKDAAGLSKGIKTLSVRMDTHCSNAKKVANFLSGHEIAKRQMKDFGVMMSLNLRGGFEAGKLLMNNVELFSLATSLGNMDSLIQHSASMSHASLSKEERESVGIADGQVRLSIGIENVEDIIYDLDKTFNRVKQQMQL